MIELKPRHKILKTGWGGGGDNEEREGEGDGRVEGREEREWEIGGQGMGREGGDGKQIGRREGVGVLVHVSLKIETKKCNIHNLYAQS